MKKLFMVECNFNHGSDELIGVIFFKTYKSAKSFGYHWTLQGTENRFVRIFEYQTENYYNDFKRGYQWVLSFRNGSIVGRWGYVENLY